MNLKLLKHFYITKFVSSRYQIPENCLNLKHTTINAQHRLFEPKRTYAVLIEPDNNLSKTASTLEFNVVTS